jgi:hypothetical protein
VGTSSARLVIGTLLGSCGCFDTTSMPEGRSLVSLFPYLDAYGGIGVTP